MNIALGIYLVMLALDLAVTGNIAESWFWKIKFFFWIAGIAGLFILGCYTISRGCV